MTPLIAFAAAAALSCDGAPVVERFFEAFNAHDPAAMADFAATEIRTIYLAGDGSSETVRGAEALESGMADYFASLPDVASAYEIVSCEGDQIVLRETVTWGGEEGEAQSQSALALYRVRDSLIDAVWYFPAIENSAPDD